MDFVVEGDVPAYARSIADQLGLSFFVLDKALGTSRVVAKENGKVRTVDFAALRGRSIRDDLLLRDFTIDAMAVDLKKIITEKVVKLPADVIDPTNGWQDLKAKRIEAVSNSVFLDDPLRLIRAFRLSASIDFRISERTLKLIKDFAYLIQRSSAERVQDELLKILSFSQCANILSEIDKTSLANQIFPELTVARGVKQDGFHHLDVWDHSFLALQRLDNILAALEDYFPALGTKIQAHLDQDIQGEYNRLTSLKLAALFHDVGKPATRSVNEKGRVHFIEHQKVGVDMTEGFLTRLRLSDRFKKLVLLLVKEHLRPGFLTNENPPTRRAIYRFLRDTGDAAPETLLLSLADRLAARGPAATKELDRRHQETVYLLMEQYYRRREEEPITPLVTGDDLMTVFHLKPGPLIGELLETIREAQAEGKIGSKDDALRLAKKYLQRRTLVV
jgi:poly(A) polymerase